MGGVGAPDFAVSRDGKSVLVTVQLGSFSRLISVPAEAQTPVQTLLTSTSGIWGVDSAPDGSIYLCITDQPAELVNRSVDRDETEAIARFPGVSDESVMTVLPDGRAVLTVVYSDRARVLVVEKGKNPVALVTTAEETSAPLTVAGPHQLAFMIGPRPRDTIALADIETGLITRRIAPGKGEILSLAASPDGATLYFAAGGMVWSIASTGGEERKIRAGNRVVASPTGQSLVVSVLENPDMRLFRVAMDGSAEIEIPTDRSHSVEYSLLSSGAWNRDGRLLVSLQDGWFNAPAILDTLTGRVQPLPFDNASGYLSIAWLPDGRIMALRLGTRSTLWRFQQAKN